jgi:hypothetical protein
MDDRTEWKIAGTAVKTVGTEGKIVEKTAAKDAVNNLVEDHYLIFK